MVQIHALAFVLKSDLLEGLCESLLVRIQDQCLNDFTWADTAHAMITLDEFREAVGCEKHPNVTDLNDDETVGIYMLYHRIHDLHKACGGLLMVDLAR